MGEIRSTLDIIMEKTRGLRLSDEERDAIKRREIEGRVKGLLQKVLDGAVTREEMTRELQAFGDKERQDAKAVLWQGIVERLDPQEEQEGLMALLQDLFELPRERLDEARSRARHRLAKARDEQVRVLRARLQARGISGDAVLPNLQADPGWAQTLTAQRAAFRDAVAALRDV